MSGRVQPPDDTPDDPDEAWRDGFEAAMALVQKFAATQGAAGEDADDGGCPDCGGELKKVLGGHRCQECGERTMKQTDTTADGGAEL